MQPSSDVVVAMAGASLALQFADAVMANAFVAFTRIFQMNTANGAQEHVDPPAKPSAPRQQRSRCRSVVKRARESLSTAIAYASSSPSPRFGMSLGGDLLIALGSPTRKAVTPSYVTESMVDG